MKLFSALFEYLLIQRLTVARKIIQVKIVCNPNLTLCHQITKRHEAIFVVEELKTNLLGLSAMTGLKLLSRVYTTSTKDPEMVQKFPKVFNGLGTIGEEYAVKLKENATPCALFVPRNVPIPLRQKVKEELDRMEKMKVITKAEKPTQWCAGMVVVPKKSGDVRICVDRKQ